MQHFEWFEKDVGTYLKVVRFSEPTNPDGFVVLYLRTSGFFLLVGYWRGYERSAVAGRWVKEGSELRLEGRGHISTDCVPGADGGHFERVFAVADANHTPLLTASNELKGWSLLGWKGPFMYVGRHTIIDPDGQWLPGSASMVDERIAQVLGE